MEKKVTKKNTKIKKLPKKSIKLKTCSQKNSKKHPKNEEDGIHVHILYLFSSVKKNDKIKKYQKYARTERV